VLFCYIGIGLLIFLLFVRVILIGNGSKSINCSWGGRGIDDENGEGDGAEKGERDVNEGETTPSDNDERIISVSLSDGDGDDGVEDVFVLIDDIEEVIRLILIEAILESNQISQQLACVYHLILSITTVLYLFD
jgi:hypothetical protein